jgi:hypothetical protein
MTCQDTRELFSVALDDALGAVERERLEAHLAGCADCRREWARFEQTVSLLRGAEPIRAPAGFVDRVLEAVRPEPWWRRLITPWAWRLPLQAAAVAVVTIVAVLLYRGTPEQRQVIQTGTRFEERAARPPSPAPEPAAAPPRTAGPTTSTAVSGASPAEPPSAIPTTALPAATPPEQPLAKAEPRARTDSAPAEAKPVEPGAAREGAAAPAPPLPQRPETGARPVAKTRREAPIGVDGRLSGIVPALGRQQVGELVGRLGGTIAAERPEANGLVIDIRLPRARYDELARELAQLGRWTASDLTGDADPVRVLVRLVD